ncbi:MAG: TldD/PmbA family protein [Dehalococcoidia bacterium]
MRPRKEYLGEILRSARKVADEAEVFALSSPSSVKVQFEANRLRQVQTRERNSVALRIFREGRVGFATAGGGVDTATLVDMAVETSEFGGSADFEFPVSSEHSEVRIFDSAVDDVSLERMVEAGRSLIDKITEHTPGILCDVDVTRSTSSVSLINSRGGEGVYDKSVFGLSVQGVLVKDTDMLFVGDSDSSCRFEYGVEDMARRIKRQLDMAKANASVSAGLLPVIFTPSGVASALLSPITVAFSGKTVLEGASPLKGRQNERLLDKGLSLWDDATLDHAVRSCPFDDEGVPTRRLPLVESGVVKRFFYDLQTAALAGTESTGNGRRVGGSVPTPATSSIVVGPGDVSFESMVEDMREGLIVEHVIGAGQGNVLSGDFGGNVLLGYKVENGQIVGRVKDTMIAGNVFKVLEELIGIGREATWGYSMVHTPPLYCPRVSVSTKGN